MTRDPNAGGERETEGTAIHEELSIHVLNVQTQVVSQVTGGTRRGGQ